MSVMFAGARGNCAYYVLGETGQCLSFSPERALPGSGTVPVMFVGATRESSMSAMLPRLRGLSLMFARATSKIFRTFIDCLSILFVVWQKNVFTLHSLPLIEERFRVGPIFQLGWKTKYGACYA